MKYGVLILILICLLPACCMRKEGAKAPKNSFSSKQMPQEPMPMQEIAQPDLMPMETSAEQAMDEEVMNEQVMGDAMDIQINE